MKLLQKLTITLKLKIATLSPGINETLDWESSEKLDFLDSMYQREKKLEEELGKVVLKFSFAIQ